MSYQPWCCGFVRLAASGTVSDAGKPILIAGYSVDAGGSVTTPYFRNGTAVGSATAFAAQTTAANQSSTQSIPMPVMFPNGCFVSFDSNTNAVTVFYILNSVTS